MIRKILVAVDASRRAQGVFDAAAEMAARFGASLVALRVIDVPPELPAASARSVRDELAERLTETALAELRGIARDADVDVLVRAAPQEWRAIVDAAEEVEADLVVIGSHGYRGLDRILGTTAAKVVNHATRSVLVVHERPDASRGQ